MRYFLGFLLSFSLSGTCWAAASRNFDGATNDRVDWGDDTTFDNGTSLSIFGWLYLDATGNKRIITKWQAGGDRSFLLEMTDTDELQIAVNDNSGRACVVKSTNADLGTATWIAIAGTWTTTCTVTLYKNATSLSVSTVLNAGTTEVDDSSAALQVGHETDEGVDGAEGNYGYFGIWRNYVLTASDMVTLSAGAPPTMVRPDALLFFAPIWGDAAELDLTGSNGTGSVTGTTTTALGPPLYLTTPFSSLRRFWNQIYDWFIPSAWADDIIICDPSDPLVPYRVTRYVRSVDPNKDGSLDNPDTLIWMQPLSNSYRPWSGIPPPGSSRYWKCIYAYDVNHPEVMIGGTVVEMTQAEKDALDAPTPEQQKQAALQIEAASNLYCTDDLSVIDAEVDKAKDLNELKAIVKTVARCARVK